LVPWFGRIGETWGFGERKVGLKTLPLGRKPKFGLGKRGLANFGRNFKGRNQRNFSFWKGFKGLPQGYLIGVLGKKFSFGVPPFGRAPTFFQKTCGLI